MADPNAHIEQVINRLRSKFEAGVAAILDEARQAIDEALEPERPVPTDSGYMWVANTDAGRLHVIRHAAHMLHRDEIEVAIYHQAAERADDMVARIRPASPPVTTASANLGDSTVGFTNGSRLLARDTRHDGLGVKGLHPHLIIVLLPHMAAWPLRVWAEIAGSRYENTEVIVLVDGAETDTERADLVAALDVVRAHVGRRGLFDR